MLTHGIPKMNMLSNPSDFGSVMGIPPLPALILCLLGEVLAPALIIIGFKTKLAAIPAAITMIVAAFVIHAGDTLANKEHALLYLIAWVVIFLAGPGRFSIDGK